MDARTGKVIQAVNADTRVHPASLTKMMTLYIVFDQIRQGRLSLDQKITVSANAADRAAVAARAEGRAEDRAALPDPRRGDQVGQRRGDGAWATPSAAPRRGSRAMMNQYARAMGMTNTTFKNANGLTRDGHMSTARDMATLGRRLVYDFPQYYNIFGRTSTSAGIATVKNTNRRVLEAYKGADGIKTGYTKAAGLQRRLLGAARRQAGDRGGARRQVDRLAQRRGRAADGRGLRQDAGDGARGAAGAAARRDRRRRAAPKAAARAAHASTADVVVAQAGRRRWRSPPPPGRCRARSTARRSRATARPSPRRSPR